MQLFEQPLIITNLLRSLYLSFLAFVMAMALTPAFTYFAFKYEWWRKARKLTVTGEKAKVFSKLHAEKHKRNIPTMAGSIVIITVVFLTLLFNFDRKETYLPLVTMILFAGLGL